MPISSSIRNLLALALCGCVVSSAATSLAATAKQKKKSVSSTAHAGAHTAAGKTSTARKKTRGKGKGRTAKARGQKAIESERAQQIQEALIREHYLAGEPSGKWDDATQAALRRFQADQGWQSKSVPDSRALIKLGLGPNHDHLLNPETAMTTPAPAAGERSKPSAAGKAAGQPAPVSDASPQQ